MKIIETLKSLNVDVTSEEVWEQKGYIQALLVVGQVSAHPINGFVLIWLGAKLLLNYMPMAQVIQAVSDVDMFREKAEKVKES